MVDERGIGCLLLDKEMAQYKKNKVLWKKRFMQSEESEIPTP